MQEACHDPQATVETRLSTSEKKRGLLALGLVLVARGNSPPDPKNYRKEEWI